MQSTAKMRSGFDVRQAARIGEFADQTAGQAPDYLQGNVVILPLKHAAEFLHYCLNNPKPCPLIGMSQPGDVGIASLASDLDIRKDIPRYRVFSNGQFVCEETDITSHWKNDFVTFVLGCSFTFEEALIRNGFPVRHIEQGRNVPMFKTNIETMSAGIFSGPLVVTMRSFPQSQIPEIFDLSSRFPHAHGTPVYWGDSKNIGISNLQSPDYGDSVDVPTDEVPVFWACGVTPQVAIEHARPEMCITHAPGCMLVTDLLSSEVPSVEVSLSQFWKTQTRSDQSDQMCT